MPEAYSVAGKIFFFRDGALIDAVRSANKAMQGISIAGFIGCGALSMAEVAPLAPLAAISNAAVALPAPGLAPAPTSAPGPDTAAAAASSSEPSTPPVLPVAASQVMLLAGALFIRRGLCGSTVTGKTWILADDILEDATITEAGQTKTVMAASTSRLVAVFGMLVTLSMYLGIGIVAIWDLVFTARAPSSLAALIKFMLGGLALFAPYFVNQVRVALTSV